MNEILRKDYQRLGGGGKPPLFQRYYRKCRTAAFPPLKLYYKLMLRIISRTRGVELSDECQIGEGLYLGHSYAITINPKAVIGKNCNIHKGVTIGQENRGKRNGTPTIGNMVWIGVNATVVGKITIGDDVLIAPNSYVNSDVPSHSIVLGNPCIIIPKENATENYINNTVD